jgi:hypothetical protein
MKPKRWRPERPSKKAALAAFNSQRPLDAPERDLPKRTGRKFKDDGLPEEFNPTNKEN